MRVVIQRVSSASLRIDGSDAGRMGPGMVVLLAVSELDKEQLTDDQIAKLAAKTANLRIFDDGEGRMNLSAVQLGLAVMVVSQFTLYADTRKGNRPSFTDAATADFAEAIYDRYVANLSTFGLKPFLTGSFGADMEIELTNDGPVTIIIDTKEWQDHG
ncbi:MAG: D-aminoacyl-tRNA deacylase [Oscillospiraceae bacterium]|nr:D-aminoacyl-tRNA deacylase [Oscillospiraceae bacterium]